MEKIASIIDKRYINNITIYETKEYNITNQSTAFTQCYRNNINKFDWFLMIDMDEFLYNCLSVCFSKNIKLSFINIDS